MHFSSIHLRVVGQFYMEEPTVYSPWLSITSFRHYSLSRRALNSRTSTRLCVRTYTFLRVCTSVFCDFRAFFSRWNFFQNRVFVPRHRVKKHGVHTPLVIPLGRALKIALCVHHAAMTNERDKIVVFFLIGFFLMKTAVFFIKSVFLMV